MKKQDLLQIQQNIKTLHDTCENLDTEIQKLRQAVRYI